MKRVTTRCQFEGGPADGLVFWLVTEPGDNVHFDHVLFQGLDIRPVEYRGRFKSRRKVVYEPVPAEEQTDGQKDTLVCD